MRILLVEDDESIVEVLTAVLTDQNYIIDVATDGEAGWELVEAFPYDLLLLDIMLPKLDGITFCRRLRERGNSVLVMMLTVRDTTTDKLIGLDSGADDYVVKPFNVQELVARIRALLRRGSMPTSSVLVCGSLRLDPNTRTVTYAGNPLPFSRKEYLLLELFLRSPHRVFSRSAIVDHLWSFTEEPPNEDTIKSHIKNVRQKLRTVGADDLIETLYGQGYRINPAYLVEPNPLDGSTETRSSTLSATVAQIWQRTKGVNLERLASLEQTVQALKSGMVDEELVQRAEQAAHKLAGSLGTFGFDEGSRLARQVEDLLQSRFERLQAIASAPDGRLIQQIEQLITALHQTLKESQSQSFEPIGTQPNASLPIVGVQPLLLIVEDDRELAESLAAEAVAWNIRTTIASDLEIASAQVQENRPDLILFGFPFTEDTSSSFLSQLIHQAPTIPVVIFSAQDRSSDRVAAVRMGAKRFLPKTITPSQVLHAIAELVSELNWGIAKILVVEQDPQTLRIVQASLEPHNIQLIELQDPRLFWETLRSVHPDLLVLNVHLPEVNGFELCQSVRQDFQWNWLPILILVDETNPDTIQRAFAAGVDDYLTKPLEPDELSTRILNRLQRSRLLRSQAETDVLTDLANRQQSTRALNQLLHLAHRSQETFCLAVLDLDHFKQVNDQYGHIQGDRILRQFGQFLKQKFRTADVVARWGGEEFVVGMYGISRADGVERLAEILEEWRSLALTTPSGDPLYVSFSAGVAQYPLDGVNLQMLYRTADAALYRAKVAGRDRVLSAQWQPLSSSQFDVALVHPDDDFARRILRAMETRGYHTLWMQSGQVAIEQLARKNSTLNVPVILLSDTLTDLDVFSILRQFSTGRLRQTRIILLLSQLDIVGQAHHVFDYILTPCSISVVMQRLRQALDQPGGSR